MNRPPKHHGPKFTLIGFRIDHIEWSRLVAIMTDTGATETALKELLKTAHGMEIEGDPIVYYTVTEEAMDKWAEHKITPTLLQLIGSAEIYSLSEIDCRRRFEELKEND